LLRLLRRQHLALWLLRPELLWRQPLARLLLELRCVGYAGYVGYVGHVGHVGHIIHVGDIGHVGHTANTPLANNPQSVAGPTCSRTLVECVPCRCTGGLSFA
jgi:hypothetical protein